MTDRLYYLDPYLKEFKARRTHEKAICRKYFAERTMFLLPVSSFDADYWPR